LKYYLIQPPEVIHLPNPERLKPKERQPRIITDLPKTYQFAVPITFIIHVQGELLYARIESVRFEYHGYEDDCFTWYEINWFTIKFSDGHEDEYCVDDYETTTSKGQDKYANALHGEICMALADWTEDCTVYTLGWPIDGIETNIWVYRVDVNAVPEYFVDYNGDYRFSVRFENGQWTALTVRIKDPEIIDPKLAKKVIAMLKHYHRQGLGLDGTRHGNEE
jgi:hypothetical protein